jgi:hypothetical protein
MKEFRYLFALVGIIFVGSCGQKNNTDQDSKASDIENAESSQEPAITSYSASFTINNKTYQCTDVGAVAIEKTNSLLIHASNNTDNENETFSLTFEVAGIGTGAKKFDTTGNFVTFSGYNESYFSKYQDACSNSKSTTNGTLTLKSLKDYTPQVDGSFEAEFAGQMMREYEVPSYPCANGTTSNKKVEFINVKGSLKGGYINTKSVPL